MSWLSKMFHPERGYEKGQEQLDKYYSGAQGYLNPYNQNGQESFGGLNDAMKALLNPEALENQWSSGYGTSPAAKNAIEMAKNYGLDAASSMGLGGSSAALNAIQGGASGIGMQDRQQYMQDLMQKYLSGIGIGQNIYGLGAGAAGQQANNAMNMGGESANMAYGKENAQGEMMNKLIHSYLASTAGALSSAAGMAGGMGGAGKAWTTGGG